MKAFLRIGIGILAGVVTGAAVVSSLGGWKDKKPSSQAEKTKMNIKKQEVMKEVSNIKGTFEKIATNFEHVVNITNAILGLTSTTPYSADPFRSFNNPRTVLYY